MAKRRQVRVTAHTRVVKGKRVKVKGSLRKR